MKKNANFKVQIKVLTVLLIFTTTCFLMNFPTIITDFPVAMENVGEDEDDKVILEDNIDNVESPTLSMVGNDPWWNASFKYRKLINITNPYAEDLVDHIVSIEFIYTDLIADGKMNESLKDVRIVENGILRNYLIQMNYSDIGNATIWFETNLTASNTEIDTYLYYGNNTVGRAEDYYNVNNRFGLNWWRFDNGRGNKAFDSIGNKNGTLINMEESDWVSGKRGRYALDFDGVNDYVTITTNNPREQITVSAWAKSSTTGYYKAAWQLVSKYSAYILGTYSSNSDLMNFIVCTENGWQYMRNEANFHVVGPENWHHLVGTFNYTGSGAGELNLYIDGEHMTPTVSTTGNLIRDDTGPLHIAHREGYPHDPQHYFNGIIDDVKIYDYALSDTEVEHLYDPSVIKTVLNEERARYAEVKVITYDVDGRIVPNAEVSLVNCSAPNPIVKISNTSSDGSIVFTNLTYGVYNFTVNYTLGSGLEAVVYNSSALGLSGSDLYNFMGLDYTVSIKLNLSTYDFEIVDWNQEQLKYGYITINDTKGGDLLETLTLDNDGRATFRWLNVPSYYYKIYYDNDDYSPNPTLLNESYIYRSTYVQNQKFYDRTLWVNKTDTWGGGSKYLVNEKIYTNGSLTECINKKIIKANITLSKMEAPLDFVKIYYIDKDGNSPDEYIIYSNMSYGAETGDFIEIDIRNPQISNQYLINDNYESYGLRVVVLGNNVSQQCDGIIEINSTETNNIYNRTALSKLKVQVVDVNAQWEQIPVSGVLVHVIEGSIDSGNYITNLTTNAEGYALGQINSDVEFWYLNGHAYNFTLDFFSSINAEFKVNKTLPVQWKPGIKVDHYNYTLEVNSSLIFDIELDIWKYRTNFTEYGGTSEVFWGQNMTFEVNFSFTEDDGINWYPINDPDEVICNVGGLKSIEMIHGQGDGNFTVTINSSEFSAGGNDESYWIEITGKKAGYSDPDSVYLFVTIKSIETDISIHVYSSLLEIEEVNQHYNELVNVTVRYHSIANDKTLYGATLSYTWQFASGSVVINPDLRGNGYYTFEIDTANATNVGKYKIDISAELENYSSKDSSFLIDILVRPTSLNGTSKLLHNSTSIWINDSFTIIYDYFDTLDSVRVGGLQQAVYYWYKIDSTGNPIGDTSANINLVNQSDNTYILDFETENREPGDYAIFVTLQKNNYEVRNAFIDLSIKYREISASLKATGKEGSLITVVKGKPIVFSLTLTDPTKTSSPSSSGTISTQASTPLKGATVKMAIAELGRTFTFKEVADGVYNLTIDTTDPDYQAFFMPQTLTANITISKTNYVTQTIDITIVIGMDEWPIPGFPAFYFIMIVGAIVAVVGSLATYRYIQLAKIPKFVKNARAMKKAMKERGEISESLMYPSKEEYMVKILGDKWEAIGLSLEDILGIERKKSKIAPETEEITEELDGGVA